ncbi:hypothetical protein G7067_05255 [Leucobacter insecticola]|uniref:Uncharacterized protein n=1 Tax=Leucobacter insecticola TaxID=2714934 RepID=A0A6G8FHY2_9MICO|nr:hypothetical protein [Leucobacter insecticola]QIM15961.1 hypothetical protein G7067_05255 [Leucobacter insecticola]
MIFNSYPTALLQARKLAMRHSSRSVPIHRIRIYPDQADQYEVRYTLPRQDDLWRSCVLKLTLTPSEFAAYEAWLAERGSN